MKVRSGSAVIMVLCITSIIIIATTASWYSALLLHDVSCVRQQTFQYRQSAQALLIYAISKAKQEFDTLLRAPQPVVLYQGQWPCDGRVMCTGTAISHAQSTGLMLSATVYNGSHKKVELCCIVTRAVGDDDSITIVQWGVYAPVD